MASVCSRTRSSSTNKILIAPPGEFHDHGQPTAGGLLGAQRTALRLDQAPGHGEAETDTVTGPLVTQALERLEQPIPFLDRDAGTVVDDQDARARPVGHAR